MVVVLAGYTPAGDPYRQLPEHFVSKWPLQKWADGNKIAFLVVNVGTSLYPQDMVDELLEKTRRLKGKKTLMLIGLSTGVEGVCKLIASSCLDVRSVVGISGTYDLFSLEKESGEYRIHAKQWGERSESWKNHDPFHILSMPKKGRAITFHLFSEDLSIYRNQMDLFVDKNPAGVRLVSHPYCGKGMGHNWDFWASPCLIDKLGDLIAAEK